MCRPRGMGAVLVCAALNQQQEVCSTPRDKWFQLGLGLGGFLVADGEVPLLCRSPAFCIPLCSGGLPVSGDRGRQSLSCHSNGDSEHRGVIFGFFFFALLSEEALLQAVSTSYCPQRIHVSNIQMNHCRLRHFDGNWSWFTLYIHICCSCRCKY